MKNLYKELFYNTIRTTKNIITNTVNIKDDVDIFLGVDCKVTTILCNTVPQFIIDEI